MMNVAYNQYLLAGYLQQIAQQFESYHLLSRNQHGFTKFNICPTQPLNYIDTWTQNDVVYFDKVDHEICIQQVKMLNMTLQSSMATLCWRLWENLTDFVIHLRVRM